MLRDLLDALRCPADHDETWLIALVQRAEGPSLVEATLSCPLCSARYAIRDGVGDFGGRPASDVVPRDGTLIVPTLPDADALAAWLGVTGGLTPVALAGQCTTLGAAIGALVEVPQLWINPDATPSPAASALVTPQRAPLGSGTLAALAVDATHAATPSLLHSLVRAVRHGGRVVAPAWATLPAGLTAVARDDAWQVADVATPARGLVTLRRRPPDV
ncbi:MAG: hypothetical protein LCH84_15060 [Gemmatimonadetes bacterium]|nr:hypothetical protein [Gemmatimonadota bacterium]